ncbi:MAG: radical SAM protein [Chloroflexota bacterium]|nr:radical SAM protein [Chloroflexota bacterium]
MDLKKQDLYRLPWSMNDNPIGWLEVTDVCNIQCEGCYRQRLTGHKPLDKVKEDILFLKKWRNCDNISIAGGEPLLHPDIMEIVAFIAENGMKPILLTNAVRLDRHCLQELKKANLTGFTIHIDSHQHRPHWDGKDETEHNELRQHFTDLITDVGRFFLTFNSTVYPSTFHEIPAVVEWGRCNLGKVHGLVFITYRIAPVDELIGVTPDGEEVELDSLSYTTDHFDETFVTSNDVYRIVKDNFSEFEAAAYLGGSVRHDSIKWLVSSFIGSRRRVYGSVGPKTLELAQVFHHLLYGRYFAYLTDARIGKKVFLLAFCDPTVRKAAGRFARSVLRNPLRLLNSIYIQSVACIHAPDVLTKEGQADMCDSCPDMTVYEGRLINSCRMDEYRLFGGFLTVVNRREASEQEPVAPDVPAEVSERERM